MRKLMSLALIGMIVIVAGCTQSNEKLTKPPVPSPEAAPSPFSGTPTPEAVASRPAAAAPGALRLTPENTKIEFYGSKKGGQHFGRKRQR